MMMMMLMMMMMMMMIMNMLTAAGIASVVALKGNSTSHITRMAVEFSIYCDHTCPLLALYKRHVQSTRSSIRANPGLVLALMTGPSGRTACWPNRRMARNPSRADAVANGTATRFVRYAGMPVSTYARDGGMPGGMRETLWMGCV